MRETQIKDSLYSISKWGKFIAIITMIYGVISALSGLGVFLVGAIPGVIFLFSGIALYRSSTYAGHLLHEYEENNLAEFLMAIAKYLKLQSIVYIISIVGFLILVIGWSFLATALTSQLH